MFDVEIWIWATKDGAFDGEMRWKPNQPFFDSQHTQKSQRQRRIYLEKWIEYESLCIGKRTNCKQCKCEGKKWHFSFCRSFDLAHMCVCMWAKADAVLQFVLFLYFVCHTACSSLGIHVNVSRYAMKLPRTFQLRIQTSNTTSSHANYLKLIPETSLDRTLCVMQVQTTTLAKKTPHRI